MSILTCAIQFGTSRIMAIAAKKDLLTGALSDIQVESEPSQGCIAHGCVVNVEQTAMHVRSIIQKLGNRTLSSIGSAYVLVGGISLHSLLQQPTVKIPDHDVIGHDQLDSNRYQLILAQSRLVQGIQAAMARANVHILGTMAQPLATARILTAEERQKGCLLVDMGAATTTVAIYREGHLQHLAVIPLGGACVTSDIASAGCTPEEAERIKVDWSDVSKPVTPAQNASQTEAPIFGDNVLPIPQDKLNHIALCRYEEIAANILHQCELSGLQGQLECGCIVTGGAAQQHGLTSLLSRRLSIARIEVRAYKEPTMRGSERRTHLSSLLGMLQFCTESCLSQPKPTPEPPAHAPEPVQTPAAKRPTEAALPTEPELFPAEEEEEDEIIPQATHTFRENVGRFFKDLLTGQN